MVKIQSVLKKILERCASKLVFPCTLLGASVPPSMGVNSRGRMVSRIPLQHRAKQLPEDHIQIPLKRYHSSTIKVALQCDCNLPLRSGGRMVQHGITI